MDVGERQKSVGPSAPAAKKSRARAKKAGFCLNPKNNNNSNMNVDVSEMKK